MAGKPKYTKLGAVLEGKKGPFIVLGNSKSSNAKYNFDVEIRVTNGEGEVVTHIKNGILSLLDPRKRPNMKEGDLEKIPDKVLFELFSINDGD